MADEADLSVVADPIVERADRPPLAVRPPLPPIRPLVGSLLAELCAPADTVECTHLPALDQYAIRLPSSRAGDEAVLLPRRALERALVDTAARRRVRNLLRTWVETPHRAASEAARQTSYGSTLDVRSLPGPYCARCEGPLLAEDPVVVREASRSHLACPPAW